jgi:protein-tyrosine phosphatase
MKRTESSSAPYNILILCVGNICRSPFAENLLRKKLPLDKFPANVFSRGTIAEYGAAPSAEAVAAAKSLGVDISGHRSNPLNKEDLKFADIILTMDSVTAENLNEAYELNDLAIPIGRYHPSSMIVEIEDPYGKGYDAYLDCYLKISECVEGFVRFYSE